MRRSAGKHRFALAGVVILLCSCGPEAETVDREAAEPTAEPTAETAETEQGPGSGLAEAISVSSLTLVNADTDEDLRPLTEGATINLEAARHLNVRANTRGAVGSVRFALDSDPDFRTENSAPYALAGDDAGDYAAWTPTAGHHTLTATSFAGPGATGATSKSATVSFSVVDAPLPSTVFPGARWAERSPESQGVDPAKLQAALSYLASRPGGSAQISEMAIVRNGYLIWKGAGIDSWHEIYSATKAMTSTVLGALVTDGVVSVDDRAVKHLPTIDDTYPYGSMTLKHLATMSAGYQGPRRDCWQLHERGDYEGAADCTRTYTTPGPPLYSPPGSAWAYSDPNPHMLGYILTRKAGKSLKSIFKERIADRIGIAPGSWDWSDYGVRDGYLFNNPAGTPHRPRGTMNQVQGGLWITPRELARVGLLYLNRGAWDGQQVLSASFVDQAGSNQAPLTIEKAASFDLRGRYGYYWWTNGVRSDGTRPWPDAPSDAYTPQGKGRNFLFVIPSWRMVIVRMAQRDVPVLDGSHGDPTWNAFFRRLAGGISP